MMFSEFGAQLGKILPLATFILITSGVVLFQKKQVEVMALRQKKKRKKEMGSVNIGAIFGMDVGGTLAKIVYFEAKRTDKSDDAVDRQQKKPGIVQRGSSDSLAQLECPDHQAALENFYTFMDNNRGKAPRGTVVRDDSLSVYSGFLDGKIHFLHFETRNMVDAIKYVSSAAPIENILSIGCTGGGAHKFAGEFEEELGITFNKWDELECLVRGMHFALNNFQDECFTYRAEDTVDAGGEASPVRPGANISADSSGRSAGASATIDQDTTVVNGIPVRPPSLTTSTTSPAPPKSPMRKDGKEFTRRVVLPVSNGQAGPAFPYLVVNIGSGVSILKVTGPGKAERVSGTSLGGGTYWGLCRLLTSCSSYEEVLDFAERGDAGVVDMLVKDIYGGDYGSKLSGSMVASSFGKLVTKEDPRQGVREEDLALALLMMITNNIGQVAYLVAQLQKCSKIFFMGNFLRQNPISCRRLAYAISFWSGGKMEAMFLVHEGYFGALGTFLVSAFGEDVDKVISVNNLARGEKASGTAASPGGGYKKSRSADTMMITGNTSSTTSSSSSSSSSGGSVGTGVGAGSGVSGRAAETVQYTDGPLPGNTLTSLRSLRGRSFSDDYATRTLRDRHAALSPKDSKEGSSASPTSSVTSASSGGSGGSGGGGGKAVSGPESGAADAAT